MFCIVQHYVLSGESRVTSRHSLGSRRLLLPYIVDRVDRVAYNLQFFVEGKNLALVRQVVISYIAQVFWRGGPSTPACQGRTLTCNPVAPWCGGEVLNCRSPAPGPPGLQYLYVGNTSNVSFIWDLFVSDNIAF